MKKIIMLLLPALVLFNACEPVVKDHPMGGVRNDIKIEVVNVNPGSNSIILRCLTPGVTGQWKNGADVVGVGAEVPLIWASLGESKFTFTAFCDGGLAAPVEASVTVTQMDVIPKSWLIFAGESNGGKDGKTWVWDTTTAGGNVWGAGGYGHSKVPNWGGVSVGATQNGHYVDPEATMTFDTNGGVNVTIVNEGVTTKGTFSFNEKAAIAGYSIGQITINGTKIPCGFDFYGGGDIPQTFDVLLGVDNDHIVLNYAVPGAIIFDPAWATTSAMWVFKTQGVE